MLVDAAEEVEELLPVAPDPPTSLVIGLVVVEAVLLEAVELSVIFPTAVVVYMALDELEIVIVVEYVI